MALIAKSNIKSIQVNFSKAIPGGILTTIILRKRVDIQSNYFLRKVGAVQATLENQASSLAISGYLENKR